MNAYLIHKDKMARIAFPDDAPSEVVDRVKRAVASHMTHPDGIRRPEMRVCGCRVYWASPLYYSDVPSDRIESASDYV